MTHLSEQLTVTELAYGIFLDVSQGYTKSVVISFREKKRNYFQIQHSLHIAKCFHIFFMCTKFEYCSNYKGSLLYLDRRV